jgi:serine/tyrosine/threonine adenylyltransferase
MPLTFDNRLRRELPGDPIDVNHRRQVRGCWSNVPPTPVADPRLVVHSSEVADALGLDSATLRSPEWLSALSGNGLIDGMEPWANNYGGHQFGNWAGQLGDGRAISLGELDGPGGRSELQLKGAGPTPYSRSGDGRAVLRSSIREFLCSEAMHHLGVPTTRALSLVLTGDRVIRDMFYDGNAAYEPGAIVCRVAPSFLRFGSFEIHASRRDNDTLGALVDHAMAAWFPHLNDPVEMLAEVAGRTARMIVEWMRVGFVHGVMNTDNMSMLGLTIDYGPYGWLDDYDPDWTPNTTDAGQRRYRYGNQPKIGLWNLARFAEALYPIVGEEAPLQEALTAYSVALQDAQKSMYAAKLGLGAWRQDDDEILTELLEILRATETDMSLYFRALPEGTLEAIGEAYYDPEDAAGVAPRTQAWLDRLSQRTSDQDPAERRTTMDSANPKYVLRNYLAQLAIDAAEGDDFGPIHELLSVMRRPYDDQPGFEAYARKRPEWARHKPGCSTLSCSS